MSKRSRPKSTVQEVTFNDPSSAGGGGSGGSGGGGGGGASKQKRRSQSTRSKADFSAFMNSTVSTNASTSWGEGQSSRRRERPRKQAVDEPDFAEYWESVHGLGGSR